MMIPEPRTLPLRPRFFWPGLLVAGPLLVLTVLAAAGLRLRWQARLGEAQEEAGRIVRRLGQELEAGVREAVKSPHPVRLFEDPPRPRASDSPAWEAVRAAWPEEGGGAQAPGEPADGAPQDRPVDSSSGAGAREDRGLKALVALRDGTAEDPGWTAAGLPVAALAAWEVYARHPSEEAARVLVDTVVDRWPSVISPVMLERGAALAATQGLASPSLAEVFTQGQERWRQGNTERGILGRYPDLAEGDHWILAEGALWLIRRQGRDFLMAGARPAEVDGMLRRLEKPIWMDLSVWHGDGRITTWMDNLRVPDSRTDEALLAEHRGALLRVRAELGDRRLLFAPLRREVWWAGGLIAAAAGAAGGGLWLSRRALLREQRLHALKSQFVASVSHELRAPIGSVRLMAEALAAGTVQGEAARSFHRLLAQEGIRLSALIENVLDFARMESGRKVYQMAETEVAALLRDTAALLEPRAAPRGIQLVLDLQPLPQVPEVDALAVQQAVMNLLDNALKFSPDGGAITIRLASRSFPPPAGLPAAPASCSPSPFRWFIAIEDGGPGIPPEEHERVFERFHRLGNELRRETQGAGIGLSLVRHIMEGHGGKVRVENLRPQGTRMVLEFSGSPDGADRETAGGPAGMLRSRRRAAAAGVENRKPA